VWEKTLLVVTYDEHGGFYDHVPPPKVPAADGLPESHAFKYLGVRVPALVASPWVGRGLVSTRPFDHTSIIRTILETFCRKGDGPIPDLGPRVASAAHLGWLLNNPTPRKSLGPDPNRETRSAALRRRSVRAVLNLRKHDDQRSKAGKAFPPSELQLQIAEARKRLKGGPRSVSP
jgi:phospholipase C